MAVGAAAVGAGIAAAGSIFSGSQAADFAEKAYKHRYQWQVKDLKKAGLNPMLSFGNAAPNVPQPNFPNVGESAAAGAQAGLGAKAQTTARAMAQAQVSNLAAAAEASRASANKSNAEADLIRSGGSAKQAAETYSGGASGRLADINAVKVAEEINALKTSNAQLEYMLKLERDLKIATARNLEAGIPPKLLLGDIATIARDTIRELRTPQAKSAASQMFKDTINLIDDKLRHGKDSAKGAWEGIKNLPRILSEKYK